MSNKFLSGRIKELLLGIAGRTEDKTVLQTTGTVGIGTTNSLDYTLYVDGSANIDGGVNVTGVSTFQDRVIFDSTNSIQIPSGTEAQKDAVGVAVTGQVRFNTTNQQFEGFGVGNNWGSLGGVKDVDGDTEIKAELSAGSDEDALFFYTGGTEKLRITSDGKIGIGSQSPDYTLDLGESASTIRLVSENNGTAIRVGAGGGGNDVTLIRVDGVTLGSNFNGESDSSQYGFSLKYMGSRSQNANSLSIFSDNQSGTQVEAVTVFQDGTVGINSTSPTNTLDVGGTTQTDQLNVSDIATFQDNVKLTTDNKKLIFGDNDDFEIFHDGSSNYLVGNTGSITLKSPSFSYFLGRGSDGKVRLFHGNSTRFETTGIGVSIINGTSDTATIAGPTNLILDPAAVGDNTGIVRIKGDLYVDGTEVKVDSTTINLADLKIGIATAVGTNLLLDGGGIGIGSANIEKTILWNNSNSRMEFNADLYAPNFTTGDLNASTLTIAGISTNESTLFAQQLSVAGVSTFANTISLAEKIEHTGDTNTHISFPSTDYIRLTTNGSSRLNATPTGYILLGTNNEPSGGDAHSRNARLVIVGRIGNTADSGRLNLQRGSAASNGSSIGSISFTDSSNNAYARIETIADAATGSADYPGAIVFNTTPDGSSTPTERLRITSDGKFGFGTGANIDERGHIETASGNCRLKLQTGNTAVAGFVLQTSAKRFDIQAQNDFFQVYDSTAATERLRITSDGKVGIGTDNPAQELEVFSNNFTGIRIKSSRSGLTEEIGGVGFSTSSDKVATINALVDGTVLIKNTTSDTERLRITSSGNVGINKSSPDTVLDINSDGTAGIIRVTGARPSNGNNAFFAGRSSRGTIASPATLVANDIISTFSGQAHDGSNYLSAGRVRFGVDGISTGNLNSNLQFIVASNGEYEAMRITSSGKVGIGIQNPAYNLDLGESASTIRLVSEDGGTAIRVGAGGDSNDVTLIRVDGDSQGSNFNGESNSGKFGFSLKYMGSRSGNSNSLSVFSDNRNGTQVEAVTIFQDGIVGINSTIPSERLDVGGTIKTEQFNVTGISTFQNNIHLLDDDKLLLGGSAGTHDGLEIYHDGNHSYIDDSGTGNLYLRSGTLSIQNLAGSKTSAIFQSGSSQEFYFNNSKKFETTGYGVTVFGGLTVSGISTFAGITTVTGSTLFTKQLNVSGVSTFSNNIHLLDNDKLLIGGFSEGNHDGLEIYHDVGSSYIKDSGTGNLKLLTSGFRLKNASDAKLMIWADADSEVRLYHFGNQKLATKEYGIDVTGHIETDTFRVSGIATFGNAVSAGGTTGTDGQYLKSTGVGVTWASFPTLRTTQTSSAANGQTTFNFTYNVNFLDVFINGVKLTSSEYTASNGTSVVLATPAFENDTVEFHSYNTTSTGAAGGGASNLNGLSDVTISSLADDHILQYNSSTNVFENVAAPYATTASVGLATAGLASEVFVGLATAGLASEVFVGLSTAGLTNEAFVGLATAGLASEAFVGLATAGLTNEAFVGLSTVGLLTATGDASNLTGLTGASANTYGNSTAVPQIVVDANGRITGITNVLISGGGGGGTSIIVNDTQSLVGTAGTIDFGNGLSVSPVSAGIVTVTVNGSQVNAGNLGGSPLTALQKNDADTDLVMNNQILHFGAANTKSRIRWGGTSSLWDLVDGDLKFRDGTTDRFTFERTTGNFTATGSVSATSFSGDGSALTGITTTTAEWTLGANGSSDYTFTGPGVADGAQDPTIYLVRGQTYKFKNRSGGHPFRIQYEFQNTGGTAYSDGIVNNGAGDGTDLYWEVRNDAPDLLHYQCTSHTSMSGRIVILGDVVTNGSWTAAAGVLNNIDTITGIANNNFKSAEYMVHISNGGNMQTQKVLVMQNGTTASSTEYAVIYDNSLLVSIGASVHGGNFYLNATPETGITGITTFRFTRQTIR